jgi:RHS repeat-associated protein
VYHSRSGRLRSKAYVGEPLNDTEYTYSLAGRPVTRVWQRGVTTSYTATPAGEVDVVTYTVGQVAETQTAPIRFGYDRVGRRITTKSYLPGTTATSILSGTPPAPVSTLSQSYDDLGQPETESWSGGHFGNRLSQKRGGDANGANLRSTTYAVNQLNQITSRTVVGSRYLDLIGLAEPGTTVTAGGVTASRRGEFWRAELNLGTGNPLWQSVNVTTSDGGSLTNALYRVPPSSEVPTYDADGNLTADGLWTYTWDAENRLKSMQSQAVVPTAGRRKLDFEYDPFGRRIGRVVSTGASGSWVVTSTTRWLYDGWNPVAELNDAGTLVREYVWGTDLSGSWQGAGGVGGLLWILEAPNGANTAHYVAYDGNGNVMGLVNAADGTWSARYEYGPFGEVLRATGAMAASNPFRWSTKIQDEDTGLNYYGYRYYSAGVGRWLGRDPIGEVGGVNIYGAFLGNSIGVIDRDGLDNWSDPKSGQNAPPVSVFPPGKPPAPPIPIIFGVPSTEWGFGGSIGAGVSFGGGFGIGIDLSKTVMLTTCKRICVTKAVTVTLGAGTPGFFGSFGPALSVAPKGRLDGPSLTVGVGLKAAAGLAGGAASFDVDPQSLNLGGAVQWSPGAGGIAGVRFQLSCTGCAAIRSIFGVRTSYLNAEQASNQCIANGILRLLGLKAALATGE